MRDPMSISMRCAASGGRFHACFTWSPAREQYVLFSMLAVPERAAAASMPLATGHHQASAARTPATMSHGANAPCQDQQHAGLPATSEFKIAEVDFTGFYCPHCGYGKTTPINKHRFVKCGTCRELVCGARLAVESGKEIFECHQGCGSRAELSGILITSYAGRAHAEREQRPSPAKVRVSVVPPAALPVSERPAPPSPQRPAIAAPMRPNLPAPRRPGLPAPLLGRPRSEGS